MKTKQFSGGAKPRTHFDRKIRTQGGSRLIAFSRFIPKDWRYCRVVLLKQSDDSITIEIYKLLGSDINSQPTKTHKTGKQDA